MNSVRTRFAPSPTGFLHVGGIRTALFAWLVARQSKGQFILRLEDTDKAREVSGSDKHIMDSLRWLGIDWDEGPEIGGLYGPYRQSDRLTIYKKWAQKLVDKGKAYADPYTVEELGNFRKAARVAKKPFLFRDYRPDAPPTWDGSKPLRLKSSPIDYKWHDIVMGNLGSGPEVIDDFILMKSDGYPTYNFAHIIDDYEMRVSHVIRSQEFLASVPKFLNLYDALELKWPLFATLPYVMGPDGKKKLSKRDGAKDILQYARDGYLSATVINFLATLGWNDSSEQEIFSLKKLLNRFKLERVQKSGARFDERRLLWMNGHYIRQLTSAELYAAAEAYWPREANNYAPAYKHAILGLVQERLKYFAELGGLTSFFFAEPRMQAVQELYNNPTDKQLKKLDKHFITMTLKATNKALAPSDFTIADITARLNALLAELKTSPGVLFSIIRIAVSGASSSPQIFGTLAVLGKERALKRLRRAIDVTTT